MAHAPGRIFAAACAGFNLSGRAWLRGSRVGRATDGSAPSLDRHKVRQLTQRAAGSEGNRARQWLARRLALGW